MNCKSSNIVYLITCDRCALQYVGETSLPLHERMYKYRNKIDSDQVDPNLTAVEEHFRTFNNHDGTADFTIQPISFTYNLREFPEDNKCRLLDLEDFWIKILKTKEPKGWTKPHWALTGLFPSSYPTLKQYMNGVKLKSNIGLTLSVAIQDHHPKPGFMCSHKTK